MGDRVQPESTFPSKEHRSTENSDFKILSPSASNENDSEGVLLSGRRMDWMDCSNANLQEVAHSALDDE